MKISVPVNHNFHEEAPIREADLGNVFNVNKSGVKHLRQIIFSSVYELKLGAEQLKQVKVFNFKRNRFFEQDEERLIPCAIRLSIPSCRRRLFRASCR